jgi:hypothetical protein
MRKNFKLKHYFKKLIRRIVNDKNHRMSKCGNNTWVISHDPVVLDCELYIKLLKVWI